MGRRRECNRRHLIIGSLQVVAGPVVSLLLAISVLLVLLLSSCSQDAVATADLPGQPNITDPASGSIRFATSLADAATGEAMNRGVTRAPFTGSAFPDGTYEIGVYMMKPGSFTSYYRPVGWQGYNTSTNQYGNVRATHVVSSDRSSWSYERYDGGALIPDSVMAFERGGIEAAIKADFYAYYPYSENPAYPHPLTKIPFDLSPVADAADSTKVASQPDYLFAVTKGYTKANAVSDTPVPLTFYHTMSLITVKLTNRASRDIVVKSLSVADQANAAVPCIGVKGYFDLSTASAGSCNVKAETFGSYCVAYPDSAVTIPAGGATDVQIYFILPPFSTSNSAARFVLSAEVKMVMKGNDEEEEEEEPASIESYVVSGAVALPYLGNGKYGFRQGKQHVYTVAMNASSLSLSGLSVEDWESADDGPKVTI